MTGPKVEFKNIALVKRVIDHDGTSGVTNKDVHIEVDPEALDAYIRVHGVGQLVESIAKFLAHVRQRNSEINPVVVSNVSSEESGLTLDSDSGSAGPATS